MRRCPDTSGRKILQVKPWSFMGKIRDHFEEKRFLAHLTFQFLKIEI